ncbi:MAG: transposase [Eubacterium sp.]|jgi:transposase|nr:transposase [Eubacterium sp.]
MGGNYEKSVYNQLMDVMARLDVMEAEHKNDRKEIADLNAEVKSLRKENFCLKTEADTVKAENTALREENNFLRKENQLLRDDNERMKRILNNNSADSSQPPSSDPPGKAPNTYNSRKPTKKKAGARPGHKGTHISKAAVEKKIREGRMEHRLEEIGTPGSSYITRYRLDLEVKTVATEIRIYADEKGKFEIPKEYRAEVSYGENIKAIAAFLYSEGVVSNDRICLFTNPLSQDTLGISTGSIYGFCRRFSESCAQLRPILEETLLNSEVACTDATTITTNGKQTYIRNLSTNDCVLYYGCEKKDLESSGKLRVLKEYTGTLIHDHETSMYHFGTRHGECDVHLGRYLQKNTEETGHPWSHHMEQFLKGMDHARKERIRSGDTAFTTEELARYESRYEELIDEGREANQKTRGRKAKKEENALLNRLEKYKTNHLLFLHDFKIPFSNNMSEKDLRICKNREKMAGGFRNGDGRQMYCDIISFVETVKRKKKNIFESIKALISGIPVIQ